MMLRQTGLPVLGLLFMILASVGSCSPPVRTTVAGDAGGRVVSAGERWLVGVWTWAEDSPAAARRSVEAVKYKDDGSHTRGTLRAGRYVEQPHFGSTPGFVSRWELKGNSLYLYLDGAEETVSIIRDGEDVFRSEFFDGTTKYVFWYVRQSGIR